MSQNELYYSTTPYHILCSFCLASKSSNNCHLLVVPAFSNSDIFIQELQKLDKSPFSDIYVMKKPNYSRESVNLIKTSKKIMKIRGLVRILDPSQITVARDKDGLEQSVLYHASEDTICRYVEDGMAAYSTKKYGAETLWKKYVRKVFVGYWWDPPKVLGTSKWIDSVALTFPKQARPELRDYPANTVPSSPLKEINKNWIRNYIAHFNISPRRHSDLKNLVIIPHSNAANREFKKHLKFEIKELKGKTAIKYHPREPTEDFLKFQEMDDIIIFPPSIPAELLYLYFNGLETVIGTDSTALLTAHWLDLDLDVWSLYDTIGGNDQGIRDTLDSLGTYIK
ncbi:polysialyltransferase family glycosyltransferase [Halorubrum ezzemoulense]|uniref:polysialyltransferase family glycosyltransferase n=1 Tax=Halorubrum ezzemoulense TaxID=337243 RepID=UPI0011817CCC|nr:polysialyltransferase family glycosyltransferase [Halorubrum ezzemoulense]